MALHRAQTEARLLRIHAANENLPLLTVIVMIGSILFALLVVATFAVADMKRGVLLALGFALAFLLGGMLVLVDQLEQPFTGIVRIKPAVISDVARDTAAKFAEAHPNVALPSNAEGRPLSSSRPTAARCGPAAEQALDESGSAPATSRRRNGDASGRPVHSGDAHPRHRRRSRDRPRHLLRTDRRRSRRHRNRT